jgi:signal transduction histidine kinase/ActR/RegA family two-component response regulator
VPVNLAVLIPLVAGIVNLTSGVIHVAISRAPGWRMARASSVIAFSAALYCLSAAPFGLAGLSDAAYLAAAKLAYVAAALHAVAWLVFAFGGPEASARGVPAGVRWLAGALLAATVVFTVTGWHLRHEVTVVEVAWARVWYHYPLATPVGDLFGLSVPAVIGLVFWKLVARVREGEDELRWHLGGFGVFFACAVDEVLVANRVVVFLSLAGVGLVAVVLPLTIAMFRRVIADARRLAELSGRLEDQVRERTAERDRAESALAESERLAALGRLAAGVGHEINNPLTYMQLAVEDVRRFVDESDVPPGIREAVANVEDGARRIQKVVEGLRSYSRRQDELLPIDPRDVVRAALKVAWPRLRHVARVETDLGEVPLVRGDEARLVQALVNLLTNAAQAMDGRRDGCILIATTADGAGGARLSVSDNGPGISADALARVAEPYFTTRASSGGLGLGLFLTRGIVDAHGGRLEFESAVGRGTTAAIVLPAAPGGPADRAAAAATEAVQAPPAPAAFSLQLAGRVLLVDDEPLVLRMLTAALSRSWDVKAASSAAEAVGLLDREAFDAMVCDVMMPGMDGMELAEEVSRRHPGLRRRMIFLTGGAVVPAAEEFLARPDVRHLPKPVSIRELDAALRESLVPASTEAGD